MFTYDPCLSFCIRVNFVNCVSVNSPKVHLRVVCSCRSMFAFHTCRARPERIEAFPWYLVPYLDELNCDSHESPLSSVHCSATQCPVTQEYRIGSPRVIPSHRPLPDFQFYSTADQCTPTCSMYIYSYPANPLPNYNNPRQERRILPSWYGVVLSVK
jgi:hypothetical protein